MNMLEQAVDLLSQLIAIPSFSRNEDAVADFLEKYLKQRLPDGSVHRIHNNLWCLSAGYDPARSTLMLNAHIDTVKPSPSYTRDPFVPEIVDGKLYGLGSNDDGGSLVSLIHVFLANATRNLGYNLLLAISAEEEVGGENGMRAMLPDLERQGIRVDMALVGEPTDMQPAIAERGLLVIDCTAHGVAGHAARNEGVNAIYKALKDIEILRNLKFDRESELLGPIKLTITQIDGGTQHNVVPDSCKFVVDVRTTDAYTNAETAEIIAAAIESDAVPRSTRVHASAIDPSHQLVRAAESLGRKPFISPTTSDMSAMSAFPSLKMGPGSSSRSHKADEFILISEIAEALDLYNQLLTSLTTQQLNN